MDREWSRRERGGKYAEVLHFCRLRGALKGREEFLCSKGEVVFLSVEWRDLLGIGGRGGGCCGRLGTR